MRLLKRLVSKMLVKMKCPSIFSTFGGTPIILLQMVLPRILEVVE